MRAVCLFILVGALHCATESLECGNKSVCVTAGITREVDNGFKRILAVSRLGRGEEGIAVAEEEPCEDIVCGSKSLCERIDELLLVAVDVPLLVAGYITVGVNVAHIKPLVDTVCAENNGDGITERFVKSVKRLNDRLNKRVENFVGIKIVAYKSLKICCKVCSLLALEDGINDFGSGRRELIGSFLIPVIAVTEVND